MTKLNLVKELKLTRLNYGWTQADVAKIFGHTSSCHISDLERGKIKALTKKEETKIKKAINVIKKENKGKIIYGAERLKQKFTEDCKLYKAKVIGNKNTYRNTKKDENLKIEFMRKKGIKTLPPDPKLNVEVCLTFDTNNIKYV